MNFQFIEYQGPAGFGGGQLTSVGGSVQLPMPERINDNPTVTWSEDSLLSAAQQISEGVASKIPYFGTAAASAMRAATSVNPIVRSEEHTSELQSH